ncbi:MAG: hypothetical protein WBD16_11900 [Pyrinomonadaceae bacterium]
MRERVERHISRDKGLLLASFAALRLCGEKEPFPAKTPRAAKVFLTTQLE